MKAVTVESRIVKALFLDKGWKHLATLSEQKDLCEALLGGALTLKFQIGELRDNVRDHIKKQYPDIDNLPETITLIPFEAGEGRKILKESSDKICAKIAETLGGAAQDPDGPFAEKP